MFSDCSLICRIGEAILRYDEDKFYFIDWTSMTCKVTPAEGEFEPAGVPDNATFLGGITFGLEGALTVNNFLLSRKVVTPTEEFYRTWIGGFTAADCIPVTSEILDSPAVPSNILAYTVYTIAYTNVTAGIADEKVFTPPEFCANSTELDMEFRKRRFYYMF
jgi:hypothetical protein